MTPLGPRLIQPTAYSPGSASPSSSETRPPSLRISPRRSSNGTPGERRAAVADRAQDEAALDDLLARRSAPRAGAVLAALDPVARDAQAGDRAVLVAEDLDRRAQEAQHDPVRLARAARAARTRAGSRRCAARSRSRRRTRASAALCSSSSSSAGSTIDVGARELAELAQLGVGERRLRRAAAAEHDDLLDRRRRRAPRSRGRRCRSARARRGRARASARRRSRRCRCRSTTARAPYRSNSWSAKSGWPLYQATNSVAACEPGQVLARDAEPVVARGADRVDDRVVALEQLVARDVARRARRRRRSGSPGCAAVFS